MFHPVGVWTVKGCETNTNEKGWRGAYLRRPYPITGHPITVDTVLLVRVLVDFLGGKHPLALED